MKVSALLKLVKSNENNSKEDVKLVQQFLKEFVKSDRESFVEMKSIEVAELFGMPRSKFVRALNILNRTGKLLFRPTFYVDDLQMIRKHGIVLNPDTGEVYEKYQIRITTSPLGLQLQP